MTRFLSAFCFAVCILFSTSLFAQEKKITNVQDENQVEVELVISGNLVKVKNATVGKFLNVYSVVGKKIESIEIKSVNEECTLQVPKGLYILKIENIIRKVVIK